MKKLQNKPVARDAKGRLLPGQTANPGGRPKGFGEKIRELTKDGDELVTFALSVMRGELTIERQIGEAAIPIGPDIRERLEAMKWLGDRGWGKAVQPTQLSTTPTRFEAMSDQELESTLRELGIPATVTH